MEGREGGLDFRRTYREQIGFADASIFLHLRRPGHKLRGSATMPGGVAGSFRVRLCLGQSLQGLQYMHVTGT